MMRISGYTPLTGIAGRNQKKRTDGSGSQFDLGSSGRSESAASAGSAGGIAGIDALLALQEVDDPLTGRRRAMARGHDMLDMLEEIKVDLLAGRISPERLTRLAMLLERRIDSGNPALEKVVDEIELRAKVELAKLGLYGT
ncbi:MULTISPECIES: flagellar assembly protein FliX [unclassified Stappia]|uniref:flagellar assembly protein FliX n=1 Tax=unclassified Stappia TaxID=2629676 RepID=UPI001AD8DA28|nr:MULTISPECIES: flagellar assembly protein FliX [unclassified Stappia]